MQVRHVSYGEHVKKIILPTQTFVQLPFDSGNPEMQVRHVLEDEHVKQFILYDGEHVAQLTLRMQKFIYIYLK